MLVRYSGKKIPIELTMPWLTEPVNFTERDKLMNDRDALRLCLDEAPTDFTIIPDHEAEHLIEEDLIEANLIEAPINKPAPRKRKAAVKKE